MIKKRRDIRVNINNEILPSNSIESPSLHLVVERGAIGRQTVEQQHQEWLDEVAGQLIQQRLITDLNDAAVPFQYAYAQPYYSNYHRMMSAGIAFAPERREKMHRLFISTLTSLRSYGVTQAELDSVMANWQGELTNLDSDWSKRKPNSYADARVFQLEQNSVSQSKSSYAHSLATFLDNATLASVNAHITELLSLPPSFSIGMSKNETRAKFPDVFSSLNTAYFNPEKNHCRWKREREVSFSQLRKAALSVLAKRREGLRYTHSLMASMYGSKGRKSGWARLHLLCKPRR